MKIKELIHTLYLLAFLLPLFAMGGCSQEELSGGNVADGSQMELGIRLLSQSTDQEATVSQVRIIVFDAKGLVAFNKLYAKIEPEYKVELHTGVSYTLAAICNETVDTELTAALGNISSAEGLKAIRLKYTAAPTSPFVFFGEMKGVDVYKVGDDGKVNYTAADGTSVTGANVVPISIKRLVSKVTLSLIRDVPNTPVGETQFTISNLKYKVMQIPTYSTLSAPQPYVVAEGWLKQELTASNTTVTLTDNNTATWDDTDKKHKFDNDTQVVTFPSFYLPEHILATSGDDANCTYILVSGTCQLDNGATVEGNWRINPGNPGKNLERNTHYHIVGKIQGLGGIGIYADIVEVEENKITVDWRPLEGLVIVGNRVEDYNKNTNVWNVRNTYSGILKVVKGKVYHDVLFKYGSLLAVEAKSGDTFSNDDILWKPSTYMTSAPSVDDIPATFVWSDIPNQSTGDVPDNTKETVATALGDPCKLAMLSDDKIKEGIVDNGQWHMATSDELQRLIKADDLKKPRYIDDSNGFQSYSSLLIPNTYSRSNTGKNTSEKLTGSYWSSEGGNAFSFTGKDNDNPGITAMSRDAAYTVRCVRNSKDVVVSRINPISVNYVHYTGGECIVPVASNIPYWEIKCLTSGYETELSFKNGIYFGKNSGSIVVDFKRWVTPKDRSFKFQITGYGYDGKTITQDFTIDQVRYYWAFAAPDYTRLEGKVEKHPTRDLYILSAEEAEYKVHIQVYPDVPSDGSVPSDIPLPDDAEVKLEFEVNGKVMAKTVFQPLKGSRQAYATITIPANTSGSERGVYIRIVGQGTEGFPGNFAPDPNHTYYLQDYIK